MDPEGANSASAMTSQCTCRETLSKWSPDCCIGPAEPPEKEVAFFLTKRGLASTGRRRMVQKLYPIYTTDFPSGCLNREDPPRGAFNKSAIPTRDTCDFPLYYFRNLELSRRMPLFEDLEKGTSYLTASACSRTKPPPPPPFPPLLPPPPPPPPPGAPPASPPPGRRKRNPLRTRIRGSESSRKRNPTPSGSRTRPTRPREPLFDFSKYDAEGPECYPSTASSSECLGCEYTSTVQDNNEGWLYCREALETECPSGPMFGVGDIFAFGGYNYRSYGSGLDRRVYDRGSSGGHLGPGLADPYARDPYSQRSLYDRNQRQMYERQMYGRGVYGKD